MRRKSIKSNSLKTVIGDPPFAPSSPRGGSRLQKIAKKRRKKYTRAEKRLEEILNSLNKGILKGKFHREWAFAGKWILDFFFYENRLGIEVDGHYHKSEDQRKKDNEKEKDCDRFDITLLRLSNNDIFGNREILINKLRKGWREANNRIKIKKGQG